jgi:hypothetical protein
MRLKLCSLVVVASATLAGSAMAQYSGQGQLAVTAGFNYFTPSDGTIRGVFGTTNHFSIGVGGFEVDNGFKPNISWISAHSDGNKLDIVPIGYAYQKAFGDASSVQPYFKVGGGLDYIDYAFDLNGAHYSNKAFGYGLNGEVGVIIQKTILLSAKYNSLTKVDGFNFSGVALSASVVLTKF